MKYVLVTGGVVSGLGKGVTASSIGVLLKGCGYRVTSVKIGQWGAERRALSPLDMYYGPSLFPRVAVWAPQDAKCDFAPCKPCCSQTHTSTRMLAPCRRLSTERSSFLMTAVRWTSIWETTSGESRLA